MRTSLVSTLLAILLAPLGWGAPPIALQPVDKNVPPLPAGVYEIRKVSRPPVAMQQNGPTHPPALMVARIGGEVQVLFTVKTDGVVSEIMIIKATDVRFGDAVSEVVAKWRYRPALLNGKPVACRLLIPIKFATPVEEK